MKAQAEGALGDVNAARRDLITAEQLDPKNGSIYAGRGLFFWLADRNAAETVATYAKAYELGYPKWPLDLSRCEALVSLGRGDEVMGELKHGILDPTDTNIFLARSMCYQRRGDLSLAFSEVKQAMSLWESSPKETVDGTWAYVRRGEVRWAMGDRQGAISDLEHAAEFAGGFELARRNILVRLDAMKADRITPGLGWGIGYPVPSITGEM